MILRLTGTVVEVLTLTDQNQGVSPESWSPSNSSLRSDQVQTFEFFWCQSLIFKTLSSSRDHQMLLIVARSFDCSWNCVKRRGLFNLNSNIFSTLLDVQCFIRDVLNKLFFKFQWVNHSGQLAHCNLTGQCSPWHLWRHHRLGLSLGSHCVGNLLIWTIRKFLLW